MNIQRLIVLLACAVACPALAQTPERPDKEVDTWITASSEAAGKDANAKDEAVKAALRKAVEKACGVFLTSQSKTKDYQGVYDKVIANTAGYVLEYKVEKTWVEDDITHATVKARVSTKKFEQDWARIAHTLHQENNPRLIVAIAEATNWTTTGPAYTVDERGAVQGKVEDFFSDKGISLIDKSTAAKVTNRDLMLATLKDDATEIAAVGARFKAEVVVVGKASAKFSKLVKLGQAELFQYTGTLTVQAIQTDSARILVSKTFTKSFNEVGRGCEDKVLAKLGDEYAPELLKAIVEAWRKRANVSRTIELNISGMDYDAYRGFKAEIEKLRGVQAIRFREITESVATVEIEYEFTNENLADRLSSLKDTKLKVTEITSNRMKLKLEKAKE